MTWSVLVKSTDAELQTLRANCKFIHRFLTEYRGSVHQTPSIVQVSAVYSKLLFVAITGDIILLFLVNKKKKKRERGTTLWKYFEIFILCKLAMYISILKAVLQLTNLQISYYLVQWLIFMFQLDRVIRPLITH